VKPCPGQRVFACPLEPAWPWWSSPTPCTWGTCSPKFQDCWGFWASHLVTYIPQLAQHSWSRASHTGGPSWTCPQSHFPGEPAWTRRAGQAQAWAGRDCLLVPCPAKNHSGRRQVEYLRLSHLRMATHPRTPTTWWRQPAWKELQARAGRHLLHSRTPASTSPSASWGEQDSSKRSYVWKAHCLRKSNDTITYNVSSNDPPLPHWLVSLSFTSWFLQIYCLFQKSI
jgi:hypothetical protein